MSLFNDRVYGLSRFDHEFRGSGSTPAITNTSTGRIYFDPAVRFDKVTGELYAINTSGVAIHNEGIIEFNEGSNRLAAREGYAQRIYGKSFSGKTGKYYFKGGDDQIIGFGEGYYWGGDGFDWIRQLPDGLRLQLTRSSENWYTLRKIKADGQPGAGMKLNGFEQITGGWDPYGQWDEATSSFPGGVPRIDITQLKVGEVISGIVRTVSIMDL